MNHNKYFAAGICSILLACLIPIYGYYVLLNFEVTLPASQYYDQLSLNFFDLMFPLIGILGIYVYLKLNAILTEHNNYSGLRIPIYLLIATTVLFNFGLFLFDTTLYAIGHQLAASTSETLVSIQAFVSVASMMIFGVLDIIVGIILLINNQKVDNLIVAYGVISVLLGIVELTLIFSFGVVFITPVAFALLAIHFLKKPESIEVV